MSVRNDGANTNRLSFKISQRRAAAAVRADLFIDKSFAPAPAIPPNTGRCCADRPVQMEGIAALIFGGFVLGVKIKPGKIVTSVPMVVLSQLKDADGSKVQ